MIILGVFLLAFILSLMFIPLVRRIDDRLGRVVLPRQDRWHRQPTASMGGLGIFAAFLLSLLVSLFVDTSWLEARWGILVGAVIVFLVGMYDDIKPMSPQAKLGGQILAATAVIALGYTTQFFSPRIGNPIVAQLPNILLTYLWLVGITNAINLLDNMDGLAGGIALITAIFLSYFFWRSGDLASLIISLALAGGVAGFLVYNFPPASIFMGDSGSLFLGFTLATLAIARQPQASNVFAVMGVPTLLFLLPILDTALVTFTRLLRGQSPVQGGRDHTSHRLIAFGLSEKQAVLALYAVALTSGIMAAALESIQYWLSLVLVPVLVLSLALLLAYLAGLKVIPATTKVVGGGSRGAITRIMLELTFKRRLGEVILDFFLICLAYYLAFLARYGLVMNETRLDLYLNSLPFALGGAFLSSFIFGVYRGVWRYVGAADLLRYLWAALGSAITMAIVVYILGVTGWADWAGIYSHMILGFYGLFLFLGFAASRSSFRIFESFSQTVKSNKQDGQVLTSNEAGSTEKSFQRVFILGAGDAGEMALRWIRMNQGIGYVAVGFLDVDEMLKGRQIHGVEVLGSPDKLSELLEQYRIDGVILATQDTQLLVIDEVIEICQQHDCWVRSLRLEFEVVTSG